MSAQADMEPRHSASYVLLLVVFLPSLSVLTVTVARFSAL
jgi:hypothetical protein